MNYQLDKESYICVMLNFSLVYVFSYDIVISSGHDFTFSFAVYIPQIKPFQKQQSAVHYFTSIQVTLLCFYFMTPKTLIFHLRQMENYLF